MIFGSSLRTRDDFGNELEIFLKEAQKLFTTNELNGGKYLTDQNIERLRGIAQKYYDTDDLTTFGKNSDIYLLRNIKVINDNAQNGILPLTTKPELGGTPASEEN